MSCKGYIHTKKAKQILREKNLGKKNPMFGKENKWGKHTKKTKQIIGEKNTQIPPKDLIEDENLAYLLGDIIGDGCIDGEYSVRLEVNDKDFILFHKKIFKKWTGWNDEKIKLRPGKKSDTVKWIIELHSKHVVDFLEKYNISKIKKNKNLKSLNFNKIRKFLNKSDKYKALFLQGFYDSEGCVPKGIKNKWISISNNNKQLLQFCTVLLSDLCIESRPIRIKNKKGDKHGYGVYNENHYEFSICGKENLIKFRDRVGFSIKRKQNNLIKMIKSYKHIK